VKGISFRTMTDECLVRYFRTVEKNYKIFHSKRWFELLERIKTEIQRRGKHFLA